MLTGEPRVLHVLTGCTASGKTEWALRWAEARGAEIISCDALLFYRGMEIGTAKPSPSERTRVPHHLIDILEVAEPMNIARYAALALRAAEDIASRGRPVLVVGGSGFYLKAFFAPVADALEVPPEIRRRVEGRIRAEGLAAAVAELERLNPEGLGSIDMANPRRVSRALERCLASGKTLSELSRTFASERPLFAGWRVELAELAREPADLDRRISERAEAMVRTGLVGEVEGLLARGLRDNPSASRAIGYREAIAVLEGRLAAEDLAGRIARATRALARKQRTWFRTQLPPHRVVRANSLREAGEMFG